MGLDMYLKARKYFGNWEHSKPAERKQYAAITKAASVPGFSCEGSPSVTVSLTVAYWRKANQIHGWFVANIQDGKDECEETYCPREKLVELVDLCKKVLASKDTTPLQPLPGFFFGSTVVDEYYWQDIELTIKQLEPLLSNPALKDWDFEYCSSW